MKFKTYPKMILSEGSNEDELNPQGNIVKALNVHSSTIFFCQQESSVNMCAAWHVG